MEMAMGAVRVNKNIKVVDKKTETMGWKTVHCSVVSAEDDADLDDSSLWVHYYKQFPLTHK